MIIVVVAIIMYVNARQLLLVEQDLLGETRRLIEGWLTFGWGLSIIII